MTNPTPAEIAALEAWVKELEEHFSALDRTIDEHIVEKPGPNRARWKGEWIEGQATEMIHSVLRAIQKVARAALGEG